MKMCIKMPWSRNFKNNNIPFSEKQNLKLEYKGIVLKHTYKADFMYQYHYSFEVKSRQ